LPFSSALSPALRPEGRVPERRARRAGGVRARTQRAAGGGGRRPTPQGEDPPVGSGRRQHPEAAAERHEAGGHARAGPIRDDLQQGGEGVEGGARADGRGQAAQRGLRGADGGPEHDGLRGRSGAPGLGEGRGRVLPMGGGQQGAAGHEAQPAHAAAPQGEDGQSDPLHAQRRATADEEGVWARRGGQGGRQEAGPGQVPRTGADSDGPTSL